jgi:transposase
VAVSGRRALRTALTEAAYAASRTKGTYVAAHHAQIRGLAKAIGATRHDTLLAYWHVVHDGVDYRELGPDWAHRRLTNEQRTRKLVHQLQALGHSVAIAPAA